MKKYIVKILMLIVILISGCGKNDKYIEKTKEIQYDENIKLGEEVQAIFNILEFSKKEVYEKYSDIGIMDNGLYSDYFTVNRNNLLGAMGNKFKEVILNELPPKIVTNEFFDYLKTLKDNDLELEQVNLKWKIEGDTELGKRILVESKNYKIKIDTIENGDFPEFGDMKYLTKENKEIKIEEINKIISSIKAIRQTKEIILKKAIKQGIPLKEINETNMKETLSSSY